MKHCNFIENYPLQKCFSWNVHFRGVFECQRTSGDSITPVEPATNAPSTPHQFPLLGRFYLFQLYSAPIIYRNWYSSRRFVMYDKLSRRFWPTFLHRFRVSLSSLCSVVILPAAICAKNSLPSMSFHWKSITDSQSDQISRHPQLRSQIFNFRFWFLSVLAFAPNAFSLQSYTKIYSLGWFCQVFIV